MTAQPVAISVEDLQARRTAGEPVTILDVREPQELAICRFEESLDIPMGELTARVAEIPADRPVVVVCRSGNASAGAAKTLKKAGFEQVYWLEGGIAAWQMAELPLVKGRA